MTRDERIDEQLYTLMERELDEEALRHLCECVGIYYHTLDGNSWEKRAAHLIDHLKQERRLRDLLDACHAAYPHVGWPRGKREAWWEKKWVKAASILALFGGLLGCCAIPGLAVHREIEAERERRSLLNHFSKAIQTDVGTFQLHILYPSALEFQEIGEPALPISAWLMAPPTLTTPQPYTLTLLADETVQFYHADQVVGVPRLVLRAGGGASQGATVQVRQHWEGGQPPSLALDAELVGPSLPLATYSIDEAIALRGSQAAYWAGWQRFLANPETVAGLGGMLVTVAGLGVALITFLNEQRRREKAALAETQQGLVRAVARQVKMSLPAALQELHRLTQNNRRDPWEPSAQRELQKLRESLGEDNLPGQVLRQVGRELTAGRGGVGLDLLKDALELKIFHKLSALHLRTLLEFLEGVFAPPQHQGATPPKSNVVGEIFAIWDTYGEDGQDIVVLSLRELERYPEILSAIRQHLNENPTGHILKRDPRLAMIEGIERPPRYSYPSPSPAPQAESTALGRWLELVAPKGNKVDPFSGGKIRDDALFYHTTFLNDAQSKWLKEPHPTHVLCPSLEDGAAAALALNYLFRHPPGDEEANFSLILPLAPQAQHLPWDNLAWLRHLTHAVGEAWVEFLRDGQNYTAFAELPPRQRQNLAHLLLWVARSPAALFLLLGISPTASRPSQRDLYYALSDWLHEFPVPHEVSVEQLRQWVVLRPQAMKESFILMPLMEEVTPGKETEALLQPLISLAQRLVANKIIIKLFSPAPLETLPSQPLRWGDKELQACLDRRVRQENYPSKFELLFQVDPHYEETVDIGSWFVQAADGSLAKLLSLVHDTMNRHIERAPHEPSLSLDDLPAGVRRDANG